MFEGDADGAVVGGGDADLGEVGEGALVEGLGVLDDVEEVGVVGGEGRGQHALPRGEEIAGGDGVAVGPLRVGAEVERVGELVGGELPALGDAGDGGEGGGVFADEAFKEGGEDGVVVGGGGEVRVEIGGLGAHAAVERLVAVAALDGGFAFEAAGGAEGERDGHEKHEKAQKRTETGGHSGRGESGVFNHEKHEIHERRMGRRREGGNLPLPFVIRLVKGGTSCPLP